MCRGDHRRRGVLSLPCIRTSLIQSPVAYRKADIHRIGQLHQNMARIKKPQHDALVLRPLLLLQALHITLLPYPYPPWRGSVIKRHCKSSGTASDLEPAPVIASPRVEKTPLSYSRSDSGTGSKLSASISTPSAAASVGGSSTPGWATTWSLNSVTKPSMAIWFQ